jgi:hypothetical protein
MSRASECGVAKKSLLSVTYLYLIIMPGINERLGD